MARILEYTLNGRPRIDAVPDNLLLLDYLREVVGLTGTKTGCDGGECGACTVLVNAVPRLSCLTLAASIEGARVDTVESLIRALPGQVDRAGTSLALERARAQQWPLHKPDSRLPRTGLRLASEASQRAS